MKRYPGVVVDWIDSSSHGTWRRDWDTYGDVSRCRSLGFLVEKGRKKVKLLQSSEVTSDSMADAMIIPRVAVTKIRRLPGVYSTDRRK